MKIFLHFFLFFFFPFCIILDKFLFRNPYAFYTYEQMTSIQGTIVLAFQIYILKTNSKYLKIRYLFVSMSRNPKMIHCGVLIEKKRLYDSMDFS